MKTYVLVGVSKINYNDKQTGQPRTLTRMHFTYEDPSERSLIGSGVMSEMVPDRVFQDSGYEPTVNDIVQLVYEPDFKGQARLAQIVPL